MWVKCNKRYVVVFCMGMCFLFTCGSCYSAAVVVFINSSEGREMCVALGVQDQFPHGDNKVYHIVKRYLRSYTMFHSISMMNSAVLRAGAHC